MNMQTTTTNPAANLRILRECAGLTLSEVATAAGTSESWLSKIETGKRTPSIQFIGRVAGVIADHMAGFTRKCVSLERRACRPQT